MESQKIWLALTSVVLLILVVLGAVQADQRLQKNDRVLRSQDVLQEAVPSFMEAGLREGLKRARLQIVPSAPGDENAGMQYVFSSPMLIGVDTDSEGIEQSGMVKATMAQLARTFGADNLKVVKLNRKDLRREIMEDELDFVVSDAAFYSEMEVIAGISGVASLWPSATSDPKEAVGSVFFTRDDSGIDSVEQLKGHRVAFSTPTSFAGSLIAQRDLFMRGLVPEVILNKPLYVGDNEEKIYEAVMSGDVAAGVLPACRIESMIDEQKVSLNHLKFLNLRRGGPVMCSHSTELYPSYYFSVTRGTDQALTKAVSAALFVMPTFGRGADWGFPVSNRTVHDLFFDLKIGPYEHLARWSFDRFMREQSDYFFVLVLGVMLILAYAFLVSVTVRHRTKQLRKALAERSRIEKQMTASREHIANLERTGIVGQMSTMIAHELKQPLGAITNFANGLLRRSKRGNLEPKMLNEVLAEIVDQGTRASEIVNRVRAYAKRQTPELKIADMSVSIERAIETFKRSRRTDALIRKAIPPYLWSEVDSWEIELAILNLLKNAGDALEGRINPEISVRVFAEDRYWRVEVKDNGALITQEQVDAFMKPLVTTKANGMGLGLSIISSIAERHHGRLVAMPNPSGGMIFGLDIPRAELAANKTTLD